MRKFLIYVFGALIVVSVIGKRWEGLWNYVFGGASPLWKAVVMDLQWLDRQALDLGFFPIGIAIGVVGLMFTFLWPQFWEQIAGFEKFLARQREVFQGSKSQFHMLLNRAYDEWRKSNKNCPESLDELLDQSSQLDRDRFLSHDMERIEGALNDCNPDLWRFCNDLYKQIELAKAKRSFSPKYLPREDCIDFSEARKKLIDFWDFEMRRIYHFSRITRWWWLQKLDEWHITDRSLRLLPFLEAALAKQIKTNLGARHLFRFSERAFRKWHKENT